MKTFTPTLVLLFILCVFNLSRAQQSGFDIQEQLQSEHFVDEDNSFNPIAFETDAELDDVDSNFNENNESNESDVASSLNYTSDSDDVARATFDASVTYYYNDGWNDTSFTLSEITAIDIIEVESGTLDIVDNVTCSKITVVAGASLTIASGITVTSDIELNSTSDSFASLISDGAIVGTVTYNRLTAISGTNELVSAPISGQNFGDFASDNLELAASGTLRAFAPHITSSNTYQNYDTTTNATTVIEAGKGYRAATTSGGNLIYTGDITTTDVLNIAISDAGDAWNLIGNPYPSYVDFAAFFSVNSNEFKEGSSYQAIYRYTGDSNNPWETWNQAIIDDNGVTELIAPGQAFFVKAKTGGGLVDFTTTMRSTGSSSGSGSRGGNSSHYGHIKLNLGSGSSNYDTDFYFNSNASEGLDPGYDAALFGSTPPAFSIYSNLVEGDTGIPLAIQALSNTSMNDAVISLGVHANQGQEVTISITESDMSDTTDMYLEDTLQNTFTLLNTTDYIFTPTTNLTGTGRFYLRFGNGTLSTIKTDFETVTIHANNNAKTIVINGQLQSKTEARLFDVNGRVILSHTLSATNSSQLIDVSQVSAGIYIIELDNNTNERRTEKLIIR